MKHWKNITALFLIGTASAAFGIQKLGEEAKEKPPVDISAPAPISFNGQEIAFPYTDDNTGEDLLIYIDSDTYNSWDSSPSYFASKNISGKDQNFQFQCFFAGTEQCQYIQEFKPQVPYEIDVPDYDEKETCEIVELTKEERCFKKQIGTHKETRYRDEWGAVNKKQVEDLKAQDKKKIENLKANDQFEFWIPAGETRYFKTLLTFPVGGIGEPKSGKFALKAIGSLGAYGSLDPTWYSGSWGYRRAIEIAPSKVGSGAAVTNFPVLVSSTIADWKHTSHGGKMGKTDGTDMLFTLSDGTTKLDHEIERYASTTGEMIAWIEYSGTLSTTSTTTIYSYYGNSGASDQQNVSGTWDSNYVGVWHLKNGTTLSNTDSTAKNTTTITGATAGTGTIDGSGAFSGSSQYINLANGTDMAGITDTFTVEAWINPTNYSNYNGVVSHTNNTGGYPEPFDIYLVIGSGTYRYFYGGNVGATLTSVDGPTISTGVWTHTVATMEGNSTSRTARIYINGSEYTSKTSTSFAVSNGTGNGYIATRNDLVTMFNGGMDEVRISSTTRSSAWILTQYNNQSATSTFYWLGAEETDTPPAATTGRRRVINIQ
jgi:hypothetical protein